MVVGKRPRAALASDASVRTCVRIAVTVSPIVSTRYERVTASGAKTDSFPRRPTTVLFAPWSFSVALPFVPSSLYLFFPSFSTLPLYSYYWCPCHAGAGRSTVRTCGEAREYCSIPSPLLASFKYIFLYLAYYFLFVVSCHSRCQGRYGVYWK